LETIESRLPGLQSLLEALSRSTWGLKTDLARKIYLGAIRPALAYGAIAWYPLDQAKKSIIATLEKWQGKFLRGVLGAYKATATSALEIESYTEPLDLYIHRQALIGVKTQSIKQKDALLELEAKIEGKAKRIKRRAI